MRRKNWLLILTVAVYVQACITTSEHKEADHDLLGKMGLYQRFSQKIWFSIEEQNWDLADFYTHELHEITEELADDQVSYDGHDISMLTKNMLYPVVESLEEAIKQKNEVLAIKNYEQLIQSCNACHQATNHSFIKITKPKNSAIYNQDFSAN